MLHSSSTRIPRDAARLELLPFRCRVSDYVEYAFDVPMLFLCSRTGLDRDCRAITFRRIRRMQLSGSPAPPGIAELLHSRRFSGKSRFKPYLEIRGPKLPHAGMEMTFPALVQRILYDAHAPSKPGTFVRPWSKVARPALHLDHRRKRARGR